MDRRSFVATLSAAPFVAGIGSRSFVDRPGVQLYTVRDAMAEDVDATLAALAEIGYREVELAGTYGMTPAAFRRSLDAAGLRAVSGHVDFPQERGDVQRALDAAAELGHELIVVPWLPEDLRTGDGYRSVAARLNRFGEAARGINVRLGYHNHAFEFEETDGIVPMSVLLNATSAALVDWQMDIFWTVEGGQLPLTWLERYAGRVTSVHIKDRTAGGTMVDVGDGVIDFTRILDAAGADGLRYGFVEHDNPGDSLESVRRSYEYLTRGGTP